MKLKFILPVLTALCLASCKEPYNPVIEKGMSAIVVEGLVTNLREPYEVRLSMTTPYDSATSKSTIISASVSIKDDLGNTYTMLKETSQGYYYTDTSEFVALSGRSYNLHIEMPDGDIYESSAQKLLSPATVDSVHGITTDKNYWYYDELGDITYKMVYGAETFMDLSYNSDSIYQFRFDNTLIKCYSFMYMYTPEMQAAGVPFPPPKDCAGAVCPYVMYNWEKFNLNTAINLSTETHGLVSNEMKNSSGCFFPLDTGYFTTSYVKDSCSSRLWGSVCGKIRQPAGPEGELLNTKVYALNQESAVYYRELNQQLSYEGKLFDPMTVQLQGNIKCINNPDKPALGLFEVSSCVVKSWWLYFNYNEGQISYIPVRDLSDLPPTGTTKYLPDFWLVYFN
ncbi:MAG: DUF4249 family protein [Bacteroidales bacterium]|jgi:hypothetical protein